MSVMSRWYVLDENHEPVRATLESWATWSDRRREEDLDPTRVAFTDIDGIGVSTVFLGIDHNFDSDDPRPVLFETMVFDGNNMSGLDKYMERYRTWKEAEEGHREMVVRVRRAMIKLA